MVKEKKLDKAKKALKALGLVFGDIGTSPIYTLTIVLTFAASAKDDILGIISLIIWTLVLIVTVKYTWLAMSLSVRGEGGSIVLGQILNKYLRNSKAKALFSFLTFLSIALIVGDGIITPAISILSAVEGIKVIPGYEHVNQIILIFIASFIALGLFMFQKKGTDKVARVFGPVVFIWFVLLAFTGLVSLSFNPQILMALNPYHAITFVLHNGIKSFIILSAIFLCVTGSEALYADMGHLGRKPIINAWYFVFVCLIINYLGQGAYVLANSATENVFFNMILFNVKLLSFFPGLLYVLFLGLTIVTTVIASQAIISGMFSIAYQAISTKIIPMFKIDYTSSEMRSQIYIDVVNWFLFVCVIGTIFIFKESVNLGSAYGFSVSGTMTITGIMMLTIFFITKKWVKFAVSSIVIVVDIVFLMSNTIKIPDGGYIPLLIGSFILSLLIIFKFGHKVVYNHMKFIDLADFNKQYQYSYENLKKIKGTALYFTRGIDKIPPYIYKILITYNIIYQDNVFITLQTTNNPFGITTKLTSTDMQGLRLFEITSGYMEIVDLEGLLKTACIKPKIIFYGTEDIVTDNIFMKIFDLIKKVTPSFVKFYKLPTDKILGVITRI
ncbi:MAG: KUP/HAK/KT family potassium transporter, partial [Vampirovibrionia bacterium]